LEGGTNVIKEGKVKNPTHSSENRKKYEGEQEVAVDFTK